MSNTRQALRELTLNLIELSPEIVLNIIQSLDVGKLRELRLVCKFLNEVVLELMLNKNIIDSMALKKFMESAVLSHSGIAIRHQRLRQIIQSSEYDIIDRTLALVIITIKLHEGELIELNDNMNNGLVYLFEMDHPLDSRITSLFSGLIPKLQQDQYDFWINKVMKPFGHDEAQPNFRYTRQLEALAREITKNLVNTLSDQQLQRLLFRYSIFFSSSFLRNLSASQLNKLKITAINMLESKGMQLVALKMLMMIQNTNELDIESIRRISNKIHILLDQDHLCDTVMLIMRSFIPLIKNDKTLSDQYFSIFLHCLIGQRDVIHALVGLQILIPERSLSENQCNAIFDNILALVHQSPGKYDSQILRLLVELSNQSISHDQFLALEQGLSAIIERAHGYTVGQSAITINKLIGNLIIPTKLSDHFLEILVTSFINIRDPATSEDYYYNAIKKMIPYLAAEQHKQVLEVALKFGNIRACKILEALASNDKVNISQEELNAILTFYKKCLDKESPPKHIINLMIAITSRFAPDQIPDQIINIAIKLMRFPNASNEAAKLASVISLNTDSKHQQMLDTAIGAMQENNDHTNFIFAGLLSQFSLLGRQWGNEELKGNQNPAVNLTIAVGEAFEKLEKAEQNMPCSPLQ